MQIIGPLWQYLHQFREVKRQGYGQEMEDGHNKKLLMYLTMLASISPTDGWNSLTSACLKKYN